MRSLIELAERHVHTAEGRVAEQQALVERLESAGNAVEANLARAVLETLNTSLWLARGDLERYRRSQR